MKLKPSEKHQDVSKTVWYFERGKHLEFVVEARKDNGDYIKSEQFNIKASKLLTSLSRIYGIDFVKIVKEAAND
jgi:hypothetical protein